jgi:hypothetical protein
MEMAARHHCRLDEELAKTSQEWSLGDTSATANRGKAVGVSIG